MNRNWYPLADRSQDFSTRYAGSVMPNPNTLVVHSTEGTGWPAYNGGATAPHFTVRPNFDDKSVEVRQHFPVNRSARALENRAGGVETNTLNVIQVELVGTCDPASHKAWTTPHVFMPEAPEWFLEGVAELVAWLAAEWPGFEIVDGAPRGWGAYPASYGASRFRMTAAEWNRARGIVGHQHVPENSHGDPGAFPIDQLVAIAKGEPVPAPVPPLGSSLFLLNLASRKLGWTKRKKICAQLILDSDASIVEVQELYLENRAGFDKLLASKYVRVATGTKGKGTAIYLRVGRWAAVPGTAKTTNLGLGRKSFTAVVAQHVATGQRLVCVDAHLTWQHSRGAYRRDEARKGEVWVRDQYVDALPTIFGGDWNAPYAARGRADEVGPVFWDRGFVDVGMDVSADATYRLDRMFRDGLIRTKRVRTYSTSGTDHRGVLVEFDILREATA